MSDTAPAPSLFDARAALSGLEFFRKIAAGELPPPAMVALLGLKLVDVSEGRIVFSAVADERFYNGLGVAHGGWAATLLDSALGCAINTTQPAGRVFTTLELKVNYTRPITAAVGEVRCEGTVLHVGSRTATADARIVDGGGKLYAHATTTCIVM